MKDDQILIGKYMYQFRVDLSENRWSDIKEWMNRENYDYLGKFEIGQKTKKPHYQSVIWSETELSANDRVKIRQYWKKDNHLKYRNSISITQVKKPNSILKYVIKDKGTTYTTLNNEQLSKVGTWEPVKEKNDNVILEYMTKWVENNSETHIDYEVMTSVKYKHFIGTVNDFVKEYFTCYRSVYKQLPTSRCKWQIWRMMYKLQVVTLDEYIRECRILSHYIL